MDKQVTYKYINLLVRWSIGLLSVVYIAYKISAYFSNSNEGLAHLEVNYILIVIVVALMFVNWALETLKWQFAIKKVLKVKFKIAFLTVMTAVTASLITPNRIGEIPFRALLVDRDKFKELSLKTVVSSFSQLLVTILLGGIGFYLSGHLFKLSTNTNSVLIQLIGFTFLPTIIYFSSSYHFIWKIIKLIPWLNKVKLHEKLETFRTGELVIMLGYSFLRYAVFTVQYYLILYAFGVHLSSSTEWALIPVCFLLASAIPTLVFSELGVRGSVALFVFGVVSANDLAIVSASITLWLINVCIPALIGLSGLNHLNLLRKK